MNAAFDARIEGRTIRCTITPDADIVTPILCFSLMAPAAVVSGGQMIRTLGGYAEVALPDLLAGQPYDLVIAHENPDFAPANRAWLPLGAYLRHAGGITRLADLPSGVKAGIAPPPHAAGSGALCLCPPPENWTPASGTLDLGRGVNVDHEAFDAIDEIDVVSRLDKAPFVSPDGVPVLLATDPSLPPEGYRLVISADGLRLAAADRAGFVYGAVTIRHLQIVYGSAVPCGQIEDAPRFGWRGQHLDCARHFFAPETICQLLDLMALFKLNRFHWHFADDEAFRLELECYPDLWQKTAFRGEGELIPGVFGGGIRSGGSYSKADVARIVAHARRLNIEVLPEIEVPAHALAFNRALPGLRDPADNGAEVSVQGYRDNVVNPAVPKMWEVVEALAAEVVSLFPFNHLHLGGDELPHGTWAGSPAVSGLKRREHLASSDDVFGWTMARIAEFVAGLGVRPAAWEEAARGTNGGIGNNAILFSWTGQGPGLDAARAGYDVVMCPAQHVYLDMAHSADPDDWGASWAAFVGLEDTVNWSPIPGGAEDIASRIIGIEGTFWAEFTTTDADLWPMLMPRLLGVAAKAWDRNDTLNGVGLRKLADDYRASMTGFWNWHYGA